MKVFTLVMLILASFIGAGFCSGREVSTYFVELGSSCYVYCIMFGVLFCIMLNIFLLFGKYKLQCHTSIICTFATIVIASNMLAGSVAIGDNAFVSAMLFSISIGIAIFTCFGGIKRVGNFSVVLVPIMLLCIIVVCLCNYHKQDMQVTLSSYGTIRTANYLVFNMITMGMFLVGIGSKYSKQDIKLASIIASVIIVILMLIMCNAISASSAQYAPMPLLVLGNNMGKIWGVVCKLIVYLALLTTLITSTNALVGFTAKYSHNKLTCIVMVFSVCAIISMFGFVSIVRYGYTFIGYIGIVYVMDILITYTTKKQE